MEILIAILVLVALYVVAFFMISGMVRSREDIVIQIFLQKVAKIPAMIEVMRPYVSKPHAFSHIIEIHTKSMIQENKSIYDILELNMELQNDFLFLMQLSVHIPALQKDEYFLYIRDFIIEYERLMRSHFSELNRMIRIWNIFISIKNATGIGYLLPGKKLIFVS